MYIGLDKDYNSLILYQYGRHNNKEKTMKKNDNKNNEVKAEKMMSMFDLMKMIDNNTRKIERYSMKIDKLNNLNIELKSQLKTMIEKI